MPRSVIHDDPKCRAAYLGFGTRPDDRAVVAEVAGEVVGACWVRTTEFKDTYLPRILVDPVTGEEIDGSYTGRRLEGVEREGVRRAVLTMKWLNG